jgi:Flp pilus assembly pilin Flp
MRKILGILREERGAETLEWILIGGIIILVGIAVYGPNSVLNTELKNAVTKVAEVLNSGVSSK